jgi:hypothetical protein
MRSHLKSRWARRGPKFLAIALVALLLASLAVMLLWNWLVPAIFGLHAIHFGQALGLLVLARLLVGGFHGRGGCRGPGRHRMIERWMQMSPEEREQFMRGLHKVPEQPTAT